MTFFTALAFVPVYDTNDTDSINLINQINLIREKYDKAYNRWPLHINLIFPYVDIPNFENIQTLLHDELNAEYQITFDILAYFNKKQYFTFHLRPSNEHCNIINTIRKQIVKKIDDIGGIIDDNNICPHLTLGQCVKDNWDNIKNEVSVLIDGKSLTLKMRIVQLFRNDSTGNKMAVY